MIAPSEKPQMPDTHTRLGCGTTSTANRDLKGGRPCLHHAQAHRVRLLPSHHIRSQIGAHSPSMQTVRIPDVPADAATHETIRVAASRIMVNGNQLLPLSRTNATHHAGREYQSVALRAAH
jgi:hypothetical protein